MSWIVETLGEAPARIAIWMAVVLGLAILALAVVRLVRSLVPGTFIAGGGKRRQRLAVIDATAVDSRRRLVLVRRDEREHLLLIGGPTDVVVEGGIDVGHSIEEAEPAAAVPAPSIRPAAPVRPAAAPAERRPEPTVRAPAPEPAATASRSPTQVAATVAQTRYAEAADGTNLAEAERLRPAVVRPHPAPPPVHPPVAKPPPPTVVPPVAPATTAVKEHAEHREPDFTDTLRAALDEQEPSATPARQPAPATPTAPAAKPSTQGGNDDMPSLEEEMKRLLDQLSEERSGT